MSKYYVVSYLILSSSFLPNLARNNKKIRMYTLYTPSHEIFYKEWFLPSLKDDYELVAEYYNNIMGSGSFRTEDWFAAIEYKVDLILRAVKENYGGIFVFSDVDIQFFRPTKQILLEQLKGKDIVFQKDNPRGMICTGFFACRANKRTLKFWMAVKECMAKHRMQWHDQTAANHLLRREPKFPNLHWGYLPAEFFSGGTLTGKRWLPGNALPVPKNIILHHANWTSGFENKALQLQQVKVAARQTVVLPISIPKAGTHLVIKCLNLMNLSQLTVGHYSIEDPEIRIKTYLNSSVNSSGYIYDARPPIADHIMCFNHLIYSPKLLAALQNDYINIRIIFLIRDPRDRLVSAAHWMKERPNQNPLVQSLTISEIIMSLVDQNCFGNHCGYSIQAYSYMLGWANASDVLTVRFENLVGDQGGGSKVVQIQEIKKIAKHIGIELDELSAECVANRLFSESATFREGQIGGWKKHITKEHREVLKKNEEACKIIVDLGYEKDNNWLDAG